MHFNIFNTFMYYEYDSIRDVCFQRHGECEKIFDYRKEIERSLTNLKDPSCYIFRTGLYSQEAYDAMMLIAAISHDAFAYHTDREHAKMNYREVPGWYGLSKDEQAEIERKYFEGRPKRDTKTKIGRKRFREYAKNLLKPIKVGEPDYRWCKKDLRDMKSGLTYWSYIESILRLEGGEICLIVDMGKGYSIDAKLTDFAYGLEKNHAVMKVMEEAVQWFGTDSPTIKTFPALLDPNSFNYDGSAYGLFSTEYTVNINTIRKIREYLKCKHTRRQDIDSKFGEGSYDQLVGAPCYTPFVTLDLINDVRQSFHQLILNAAREFYYIMAYNTDEQEDLYHDRRKYTAEEFDRLMVEVKERQARNKAKAAKVISDARAEMDRRYKEALGL